MGILHEDQYTFLSVSHSVLPRMRNVSDKSCRENQNTHLMQNFRESWLSWDNVGKYFRAEQATDDNMVLVHCMLDTKGYNYTLWICTTYFFSMATVVAWTCLHVMLNAHCMSCLTFPVFRPSEQRREEEVAELLNRSLTLDETPANVVGEEYAVIQSYSNTALPPRRDAPRGPPLSMELWAELQDEEGRIVKVETVKDIIFRGVSIMVNIL